MKLITVGATLCLAAAAIAIPSYASEHRKTRNKLHHALAMQAVAVAAKPGEPAYGWRYFSDAPRSRAVVISPSGDYYYSHGGGLELVFKASRAA
jgi:hypothetical protein